MSSSFALLLTIHLGQSSPWAVRATQRDATAMSRNLTHFGSARQRGVCANSRQTRAGGVGPPNGCILNFPYSSAPAC
jgi:hypothetical protein